MGRTGIYACGESVSRCNSSESVVLFSWKQEAPASIGGGTFTESFDFICVQIFHGQYGGVGVQLFGNGSGAGNNDDVAFHIIIADGNLFG